MLGIMDGTGNSTETLNAFSLAGTAMTGVLTALTLGEQEEMTDEDKKQMEAAILHKLEAGKKLSAKEIAYLKKNNPLLYMKYLRVQKMAEAMREQLKHVRSKQQANVVIGRSIAGVSERDPDKRYIVAAMREVAKEFTHSRAYAKLPDTEQEARSKGKRRENQFGDEASEEQNKLLSWSPLQEIIDLQPTFTCEA